MPDTPERGGDHPSSRVLSIHEDGTGLLYTQLVVVNDEWEEIEDSREHPYTISVESLRVDRRWDPIRDDPAFQALLEG